MVASEFRFDQIPTSMLARVENQKAKEILKAINFCNQHGVTRPRVQYLADMVGCTRQWVHRHLKDMEEKGIIEIVRCRVSRTRNDTNIYRIVGFNPTLQKPVDRQNTSTNTNTPQPSASVSALKEENEYLKAQICKVKDWAMHQVKFYRGYIKRGEQISQGRQWRKAGDLQAETMRIQARVGTEESFRASLQVQCRDEIPRWGAY